MKSSDLSYSQRQEILDKIREQLGGSNYRQLVDQMGSDDQLLDAYFAAASSQSSASASSQSGKSNTTFWDWILGILGYVFIYWPWLGSAIIGAIFGPTAASIYWALWVIGFVGVLVYAAKDNLGEIFVGIILLALLAGTIYVLWMGVPWVVRGVGQWWAWLGGHFVK
jgi:hypothetical protein